MASSPHRLFWLFFIGLFLYRLLVIISGDVPVDVEEAYYLSWTANLDWGYYSKPPLLPFILAWASGRRYWLFVGALTGGAVGLGRVIQGAHFFSDVLFGYFVVLFSALICARLILGRWSISKATAT